MLAALGNCGTYLMNRKSVPDTAWVFDVNYVNWAASVVYGYALLVPVAFYFLLQYFGCSASLTRFWCLWGYSLFIFIPSSVSIISCCVICFILPIPIFILVIFSVLQEKNGTVNPFLVITSLSWIGVLLVMDKRHCTNYMKTYCSCVERQFYAYNRI